ncbi:DEAD/DEAH box helicase [soil metagenome]
MRMEADHHSMSTLATMPPPPLVDALDAPGVADPDGVFDTFTGWATSTGLEPYPAQVEALMEIVSDSNVILSTPTGSGKSLVAIGAHFAALADGRRTFYTAPIKALVSEKFFALCAVFGADRVGMLTGDASVNARAPVICCTAEVLANQALREGAGADIGQVVMDEFHYYGDPDRGWAWQVPLLELPQAQFLAMSATLGDVTFLAGDLTRRTGRETAVVTSAERPVPLHHYYERTPLQETLTDLLGGGQAPIYVVHFTQASALERAQALTSIGVASRKQRDAIAEAIGGFRFAAGFGRTLSRLVRHGIGVHHAGMLPRYRRLVETLAQRGLLAVICGTDTLGVGINVPIRTVVFTALAKYDGVRQRHLQVREFHQIAGRAGRAGYDTAGTVVVQAPEHEVENARLLAKAGDDVKKQRKIVRKKPPQGFVSWSSATHDRLVGSDPEPLTSHFRVSHAMLMHVIARPGDPFAAMRRLLTDNHEPRAAQRRHIHTAIGAYRALLAGGVVERLPEPDVDGRTVRLTVDLPPDFALNQPLSTFALAALELLDPESPTYVLDTVSVMEATLDDPRQVLRAQQHAARGEAVAQMKAEGIEYEERMELLEDVTHPRPLAELLDAAYEMYRRGHPWVADHEVSPKSVVRDMWERAMTFGEYVALYSLTRSEGAVLRYLADAYRALRTGMPAVARTDELDDMVEWLGELVRQTDSSLLDEWEQLTAPDGGGEVVAVRPVEAAERPVTANARAFRVLVRNAMFRRVELAARRRWDALGELDADAGWDAAAWEAAMGAYYEEHEWLGDGADARGPHLLIVTEDPPSEPGRWEVRQIFDDPEGHHDWGISAIVDLAASDEAGTAVVQVRRVDQL